MCADGEMDNFMVFCYSQTSKILEHYRHCDIRQGKEELLANRSTMSMEFQDCKESGCNTKTY